MNILLIGNAWCVLYTTQKRYHIYKIYNLSLKIGIVGLPNVGKSSLFNALTKNDALVANYPFATIEPNLGTVKFLDERITKLSEIVKPQKTIYSTIDFLDIAGIVKGASKGEGLGNKFLENIREADLICLVVRCFEDGQIITVNNKIDPVFDAQVILWELIYADIETIDKSIKKCKKNDSIIELLNKLKTHLESGKLLNSIVITPEDNDRVKGYHFLTKKNIFFLGNVSEHPKSTEHLDILINYGKEIDVETISLNIHQELEISKLSEEEQKEYLSGLGLNLSAINLLISFSFRKLNLKTFFTVGQQEVRSWTFTDGWTIKQCAGLIHTDLENGFIKAKVVKYEDFLNNPNFLSLQNEGKVIIEGKSYLTQDADIVRIEFK